MTFSTFRECPTVTKIQSHVDWRPGRTPQLHCEGPFIAAFSFNMHLNLIKHLPATNDLMHCVEKQVVFLFAVLFEEILITYLLYETIGNTYWSQEKTVNWLKHRNCLSLPSLAFLPFEYTRESDIIICLFLSNKKTITNILSIQMWRLCFPHLHQEVVVNEGQMSVLPGASELPASDSTWREGQT